MSKSTPWGQSQGQKQAAPGIVFYHTAGHGGYHLSVQRMMELRNRFPSFQTFAGGPWFEEDCDWAVVVLAFGDSVFNDQQIRGAVRQVQNEQNGYYGEVRRWLDTSEGQRLCKIADVFDAEHAHMWEAGGGHGGHFVNEYRGYWCQHYRRGDVYRSVMIPDGHPGMHKRWLTDAEIDQFEEYDADKHSRNRQPVAV